jgi:cell shape-determining protein MreC
MIKSDVGRRVAVYDRPIGQGNGLVGQVVEVYDEYSFRLTTDNGNTYEMSNHPDSPVKVFVKFLDKEGGN